MLDQYGDILTVSDVAEVLGIGKNSVYALLKGGDLNNFRLGKVWKVPKIALEKFIMERAHLT